MCNLGVDQGKQIAQFKSRAACRCVGDKGAAVDHAYEFAVI